MKQDYVSHKGIITSVGPGSLAIRTEDSCHCDGCAVSMLCNKDSGKDSEVITVSVPGAASSYKVGERVEAIASSGSTLQAAVWALIVPTLLFIALIMGVKELWPDSGAWSIGIGFIGLAVYDLILYLMRSRFAKRLSWTVRPLQEK